MEEIKFSGPYIDPKSALLYCGVPVPLQIMKQILALENKRFIVEVNDYISFPGTPVPVEKDTYLVLINKERVKKLRIKLGDIVDIKLKEDTSKYGMPLPSELQEVMNEDPETTALFEALTPGRIRALIHLVAKVKSPDKRIEKAVVIFEHLRANQGNLDFKMLNVAFKEYGKI